MGKEAAEVPGGVGYCAFPPLNIRIYVERTRGQAGGWPASLFFAGQMTDCHVA